MSPISVDFYTQVTVRARLDERDLFLSTKMDDEDVHDPHLHVLDYLDLGARRDIIKRIA